jgi:C4-dicarboxylate transporter, DcuC family
MMSMSREGNNFTQIRSLFTFCLGIGYLGNVFLKSSLISNLNLILMIIVIVLSFTVVTGTSKLIGYSTFTLSIFLLLYSHAPFSVWQKAMQENLYLVVMFTMVPLLGIPIQHGGYTKALQGLFSRYVNTNSRFYLLVSFISAFIGVLVSLAVVPLVYEVCRNSRLSSNKRLLSSAISRGFTTCTIWAPTTGAITLIVQLTGTHWPVFFPFAILFGIIAGIVGYSMTIFEEKRVNNAYFNEAKEGTIEDFNLSKVIELCVFGIILIAGIAIISLITGIQTLIIVSFAALIFPIIWLGIIKRLPVMLREFKGDYFKNKLPTLKNEIILFVGAGLLAESIKYSHLGDYVPRILAQLVGQDVLLLTIVIIAISLMLSAVGVHPIITVTIIGGTIHAASYGVTPTYLALVLSTSWAMGISISPSAANVIAVSGIVGQSPIQVGIRWNGLYVLIVSVVLVLILTVLRMIGLL